MTACCFFAFLAFAGFFVLCVEAIAPLSFPPLLAATGVSVVIPNRPRAAVMAINLRISVSPCLPGHLAALPGFTPQACGRFAKITIGLRGLSYYCSYVRN